MIKAANSLTELIGNTPLLKPNNFLKDTTAKADVYLKLEYFNPLGSVKDRIAYAMIIEADESGRLKPGGTIIEPTAATRALASRLWLRRGGIR